MSSRARKRRLRKIRRAVPAALLAALGLGGAILGTRLLGEGGGPAEAPPGPGLGEQLLAAAGLPTVTPGAVSLEVAPPDERRDVEGGARCEGCDVVILTLCSLRRDHVSAYGEIPESGRAGLTPALDRIAAEGGLRFDRAYAASNFTLASLTAILTGRFGSSTGVIGWDRGLVADVPTLPEVLGYYGYRTGAFTIDAASGFRPDYGLHRGFQKMEVIPPPRDTPDGRFSEGPIGPGGATAAPAADWIRSQPADAPIFAMLHSRTAHYPFLIEPPAEDPTGIATLLWEDGLQQAEIFQDRPMPGMSGGTAQKGVVDVGPDPVQAATRRAGEAGVEIWRQSYADAVSRMDADVAAIWSALEARGRLDRTIVIALADHGESLDDHGELLHGDAYFDGVVRVPLLIRAPGLEGDRAIDALVSQVDLMPTVLELVGAVAPAEIDGRSLVPVLSGDAEEVREIALVECGVGFKGDGILRGAVIAPPWAALRQDMGCGDPSAPRPAGPAICLFHEDDAAQARDRYGEARAIADGLIARWEGFQEARAGEVQQLSLDPEFIDQLQRTGYDFRPLEETP